jgi:hypothetical protein
VKDSLTGIASYFEINGKELLLWDFINYKDKMTTPNMKEDCIDFFSQIIDDNEMTMPLFLCFDAKRDNEFSFNPDARFENYRLDAYCKWMEAESLFYLANRFFIESRKTNKPNEFKEIMAVLNYVSKTVGVDEVGVTQAMTFYIKERNELRGFQSLNKNQQFIIGLLMNLLWRVWVSNIQYSNQSISQVFKKIQGVVLIRNINEYCHPGGLDIMLVLDSLNKLFPDLQFVVSLNANSDAKILKNAKCNLL